MKDFPGDVGPAKTRFSSLMFLQTITTRYPRQVVAATVLLALLGAYLYAFKLPVISDRKQLISRDIESNRLYLDYIEEFGDNEIIVLVVQAPNAADTTTWSPGLATRAEMKKIAANWASQLRQRPDLFPQVYERVDWPGKNAIPLLYQPLAQIQSLADLVESIHTPISDFANDPGLENQIRLLNQVLEKLSNDTTLRAGKYTGALVKGLEHYLERSADFITSCGNDGTIIDSLLASDLLSSAFPQFDQDGFIFSENGRILTAYAHVSGDPGASNRYSEVMEFANSAARVALKNFGGKTEIQAGVAGMPALEYDELKTTRADFTRGTIITLVAVTVLFIFVFGHVIRPALGALSLVCAIGITFVFAWFVVGHLTLLAMIFTIILVALGIDFAIHFLIHYEQALAAGQTPEIAVLETYQKIGVALWLGGLTTAAAFFSAFLTEFKGLSDLGLIAGGGILFCLICTYFTFPAMLCLVDNYLPQLRQKAEGKTGLRFFPEKLFHLNNDPGIARGLLLTAAPVIVLGFVFGQYQLDTNLLKLQAIQGEANHWQRVLVENDDRALFAISTVENRQELAALQAEMAELDQLVRRTESLYPAFESEKRLALVPLCTLFLDTKTQTPAAPNISGTKRQVWNLRQNIRKLRRSSSLAETHLAGLETAATRLYHALGREPEQVRSAVTELQEQTFAQVDNFLTKHDRIFCLPEVEMSELPDMLRDRFQSEKGRLTLFIYPEKNTWEQENLAEFVAGIRKVDPKVTGELVSLYENGNSLMQSFVQASFYAAAAILLLLLLGTRKLTVTLFALLPLVCGVSVLLLLMKLWSVPWNFINFFALPILIGIGVDSGIHITSGWKSGSKSVLVSAVKAVVLSTLTTMIGFGVLATSQHLGVRSLGQVLFCGIAIVLLASLTLLPAALQLFAHQSQE